MRIINLKHGGQNNANYVSGGSGFVCNDPQLRTHNYNPEAWQYYYHSDHLGSSTLVTNLNGKIITSCDNFSTRNAQYFGWKQGYTNTTPLGKINNFKRTLNGWLGF